MIGAMLSARCFPVARPILFLLLAVLCVSARAETVSYEDFMTNGRSLKTCRDAGVLRLEGREYEVADGDILNIRFNV